MGDYKKLIVACNVKKEVKAKLEEEVEELGLYQSAYHSQEVVISIEEQENWSKQLNVVLVGQTKWGNGQDEFLNWLKPHVTQGSGTTDVFAIQFDEYSDEPKLWKMDERR
jgi:hypothetical protein